MAALTQRPVVGALQAAAIDITNLLLQVAFRFRVLDGLPGTAECTRLRELGAPLRGGDIRLPAHFPDRRVSDL